MAENNRQKMNSPVEEMDKKKVSLKSLKIVGKIFLFIKPYKTHFIFGMVFLLLSSLSTITFPYLLGKLIDTAKPDQIHSIFSNTNNVALALLLILFFQAAVSYFRVYLFATVTEKAMCDVRTTLYNKLITLSIPFFEDRRVGELTSRSTNDVDQLQDLIGSTAPEFIRQIITIIFGIGFIFFISAKLTLLMIATFPVLIIIAIIYGKYIRKISKVRQDALADSNVIVEETLQNINTVKSFTNEAYEARRYKSYLSKVIDAGIKGATSRGAFTTFIIFGLFGAIILVLWYGTILMKNDEITTGALTSFMLYTLFIGGSVGGLGDLYGRVQKAVGSSERIFEVLQQNGEFDFPVSKPTNDLVIQGSLQFVDVHFAYPTRQDIPILNGISLSIPKGSKIAIAGHSGAGKSTIAQLILQFYKPNSGQILIDGKNAQQFDIRSLRNTMSIVPQEVILFGGTIRENISYGKPEASEEEIIEAAKKANAWQFIAGFPDALNTIVGERGIKLSGGQRQRVAIARAILKDPAILILDEATSSLDAESEKLVQDALEILMVNRTTIIIAHRLSTIRNVDKIFVLDHGQIVETGTFEELGKMENGLFNNLLKLQFKDQDTII